LVQRPWVSWPAIPTDGFEGGEGGVDLFGVGVGVRSAGILDEKGGEDSFGVGFIERLAMNSISSVSPHRLGSGEIALGPFRQVLRLSLAQYQTERRTIQKVVVPFRSQLAQLAQHASVFPPLRVSLQHSQFS
jgi:hypothetical protein